MNRCVCLKTVVEVSTGILVPVLLAVILIRGEKPAEIQAEPEQFLAVVFPFHDREQSVLKQLSDQWTWETVELTADPVKNVPNLGAIRKTLNALKTSNDTLHGVRIDFPDELLFRDYLRVLELCSEKEPVIFIPVSNSVFALADHRGMWYRLQE